MRRQRKAYRLLALAGVLSAVAWGCSTDSPTAPRQEVPVPPGPGQTFFISLEADPGGIVISETPSGNESSTLLVEVRVGGPNGPRPTDGTTILLTTSLGSFDNVADLRSGGAELTNGRAFFTLFAGGLPVQLGIATVQATLHGSRGQVQVPISVLDADFFFVNPENNLSVDFFDDSKGNPTTFRWAFGDGRSSTVRNPVHIYDSAGAYEVTLTVTKRVGSVTLTSSKRDTVNVSEEEVEAP